MHPGDCRGPPSSSQSPEPAGYPSPWGRWELITKSSFSEIKHLLKSHPHRSASTAADRRSWCGKRWRKTGRPQRTVGGESPRLNLGTVLSNQQVPVREIRCWLGLSAHLFICWQKRWISVNKKLKMNDFGDFLIPFVHPLPVIGDNSSHSGQKTTELVSGKTHDAVKVCVHHVFSLWWYLTQEEVWMLSLRRPFHKFIEWQSPVREGGAAEKSAETKSWRTIPWERARVLTCTQSFCAGSPSAAPWTRGSWLPCLLLSAGGIPPSTCPGRVRVRRLSAQLVYAVENRERTGNITGDTSINTVNATQTQLTSCPCRVTVIELLLQISLTFR